MRDIRLEELPFDFQGKTYLLRCNMNVLADVQEAYGGTIAAALEGGSPTRSVLTFLAAMLNDYADEKGWPERFTARELGRQLTPAMTPAETVMGLVARAMNPNAAPAQDAEAEPASEPVSGSDTGDPGSPGN